MTDKLLLVTHPDDVQLEGIRILLVDLNEEQEFIVSQSLLEINSIPCVVAYCWTNENTIEWLIDKVYKSQIIIFNAASEDQTLVGYLAGKLNSYYFGDLRSLNQVNKSAIYDIDHCKQILTSLFEKYGK